MIMDFVHGEEGYMFLLSVYKKIIKVFIHSHEGYGITFKPLNWLCLVTNVLSLVCLVHNPQEKSML